MARQVQQIQGEWFELDADSIINQLNPGLSAQIRTFARNQYTKEIPYEGFNQLRREYVKLCEVLVDTIGSKHAALVLEGVLKPSYMNQKQQFNSAEV